MYISILFFAKELGILNNVRGTGSYGKLTMTNMALINQLINLPREALLTIMI